MSTLKSSIKKLLSFTTTTLKSKLQKLNIPKPIKTFTSCLSRRKLRVKFGKCSPNSRHYHLLQKGFPAIYIDELYHHVPKPGHLSRKPVNKAKGVVADASSSGSSSLKKDVATKDDLFPKEGKKVGVDEQGKSSGKRLVAKSSDSSNGRRLWLRQVQLQGVDERAEDFITKVREEMKLQREQSILDYQEMLARSV